MITNFLIGLCIIGIYELIRKLLQKTKHVIISSRFTKKAGTILKPHFIEFLWKFPVLILGLIIILTLTATFSDGDEKIKNDGIIVCLFLFIVIQNILILKQTMIFNRFISHVQNVLKSKGMPDQ